MKYTVMIIGILILIFVITILVILPPSLGKTKQFLDENNDKIEESISEKIHVDINGTSLGMFIMAKDKTKPVLLFLGGGPGIPEYFLEKQYPTKLDEDFVVCYLEYRGTSLSYDPNLDKKTMTEKQYLLDVEAVTNYLRQRFNQDKIYLLAHSFGTGIGLQMAQSHPEYYYAYIAMAQKTDQKLSEEIAFDYMYEQYKKNNNVKMVKEFEKYPIHNCLEAYNEYKSSMLRDVAMHNLGVGTMRSMNSVIKDIFFQSLRCKAYTPIERINIWRGKKSAKITSDKQFNAFTDVTKLDIPIYFLAGIHDYTCCYSLQKKYYEQVKAPAKEFYTFNESAHSPLFEEPDKAEKIMRNIVKNTYGN